MPSRAELKAISRKRLQEAKLLYSNGFYDGAAYIIGYVLETALKARICKILDLDYPDSGEISRSYLTHKFDSLIKLAGLEKRLDDQKVASIPFNANWSILTGWSETKRYSPIGTTSQNDVQDLINALEDPTDGILTWLKRIW